MNFSGATPAALFSACPLLSLSASALSFSALPQLYGLFAGRKAKQHRRPNSLFPNKIHIRALRSVNKAGKIFPAHCRIYGRAFPVLCTYERKTQTVVPQDGTWNIEKIPPCEQQGQTKTWASRALTAFAHVFQICDEISSKSFRFHLRQKIFDRLSRKSSSCSKIIFYSIRSLAFIISKKAAAAALWRT